MRRGPLAAVGSRSGRTARATASRGLRACTAICLVLTTAACHGPAAFVCDGAADCDAAAGGRCEANGACSYPDLACPSRRRFADSAGPVAGQCVGAGTDACEPEDTSLGELERSLRDLPADTWSPIAGSELSPYCGAHGLGDPDLGACGDVIGNYGSAAFDPTGRRLVVFGSSSYGGNEVYGFELATGTWTLLRAPSAVADIVPGSETNADGTPGSRGPLDNLTIAGDRDLLLVTGGELFRGGELSSATWRFDLATGTWTRGADAPGEVAAFSGLAYSGAAYDVATGRIVVRTQAWLAAYDVGLDTWTRIADLGSSPYLPTDNHRRAVIAPDRRLLFTFGGLRQDGAPDVVVWDLAADRDVTASWLPGTGDTQVMQADGVGADFDPAADAIVAWTDGAPAIFDLATRTWTRGQAASAPSSTGDAVHGKFRYVPYLNVFLLVVDAGARIYAYKHTAGCG